MSFWSSASGASIWRGYDYFKEGKVEAYEQLAENIFESRIQGSAEDPYLREVKEPKKEEEHRQQEHYKELERYVKSLKKDELQKQLYNALLELEERNNRYW